MSLCILAGGKLSVLAISAFTLGWTHSVERIAWEEDWRVTGESLEILRARVKGSGAGMEPAEGARLVEGWWVYEPALPPLPELALAASGATPGGWSLCAATGCATLGADAATPLRLWPCDAPPPAESSFALGATGFRQGARD